MGSILHILRCFGDRGWDFFVPIVLAYVFPNTLLPAIVLDSSQAIAKLFIAPKVAEWFSRQPCISTSYARLLLVEQVVVVVFGASLVLASTHLQTDDAGMSLMVPLIGCAFSSG